MRYSSLFTALLAAGEGAFAYGPAKGTKIVGSGRPRVPGAYIVEFTGEHDTSSFFTHIKTQGHTRMKLSYDLFQGASIQIHDTENADEKALKIKEQNPAVKSIYPVELYSIPTPEVKWTGSKNASNAPEVNEKRADPLDDSKYSPHVMTQIDKLRKKGYVGKGLKIAVVDTGIDYTHPALGDGCFGQGCLVSFGTDLVGDAYTGANTPVPDNDPIDCAGHGTHVAGIVAAQPNKFGFTGAAPGATLGAYRVFGCEGSAANDVLIAAFNQAYQDGADIITASIGGPDGWTEDPWALTVTRIVDKGVPCTIAAGNEGSTGQFYASGAADGKHVASVASFDNVETPTLLFESTFSVDGGKDQTFGWTKSDVDAWDGVKLPLYAPSTDTTTTTGGCDPYPANTPDLSGYIVLVRRGGCTFTQKINNAVSAGAKYVVVYNNVPGTLQMSLDGAKPGIKAAAMVLGDQGVSWINSIKAGKKVTLTFVGSDKATLQYLSLNNTLTPAALSTYTTWGPTWEMGLKPQFGAPGGNILSTWPVKLGSFAVLSGTSMATPQVAGIYALMSEALGTLNPQTIENALAANANPALFNIGNGNLNFKAPVQQQGAGLIQAYDAAVSKTLLSPSGISFNDTTNRVKSAKLKIVNNNKRPQTYTIGSVNTQTFYTLARDSIYPDAFPNDPVAAYAQVKFSQNKVVIGAGRSRIIDVSVQDPTSIDTDRLPIFSGWITVNGTDHSSLSIPYQGLAGSLHAATVLGPEDAWIAKYSEAAADLAAGGVTLPDPVADGTVFTIPAPGNDAPNDQEYPAVQFYLALGSRTVVGYAVPSKAPKKPVTFKGYKAIGQINGFPLPLNTRGSDAVGWDGSLEDGNYAPAGTYKVVVAALKLYGNPKKEEDWDVSETQSFTIKYT